MRLFGRDQSARKNFVKGTHRTRTPAETLAAYMPLMDRFGITRIADVTGLDCIGIPVYEAMRPLSRSISAQQGKGLDRAAAKASALMESIELWHSENVLLPLRYETQRALGRAGNVLDPSAAPLPGGAKLDPDRPTFWLEGWEIFLEAPVWVPFDLVHTNFLVPHKEWKLYQHSSNGLASGNCLLEAAVHGLCELIERDAVALWYLDARDDAEKESQIDLATLDADNRALIDRIHAAGLLAGVYETTSDTGIPSYQAIILDRPGAVLTLGYSWGWGCHLDPSIAVMRAITEAAQCRVNFSYTSREDVKTVSLTGVDVELEKMKEDLLSPPPRRSLAERASLVTDTFEGDLAVLREGLRRAGITSGALVDLSRPEFDLAVVKAIVPELEEKFRGPDHLMGARGRRMQKWSVAQRNALRANAARKGEGQR